MSEPAFKPKYRKPTGIYIPRNEDTERLYELERKRNDAFQAAAEELQKVCSFEHFWQEAVPEAMLNILEGWDHNAAILGAIAYLEKQNDRACHQAWENWIVVQCDLAEMEESVERLSELKLSKLDNDERQALVYILNAIKANWPR
jgi:hypothetical protein